MLNGSKKNYTEKLQKCGNVFFFLLLNVCVYSLCPCVVAHNDPQQSVLGNTLSLKRGAATEHYR